MTANQLQNVSNIETERHNRAMEALEDRRLNLTQEHNNNMDNLDYLYKTKTLELQKAQGDRKLDLQQDLNDIEDKKRIENERWHAVSLGLQEEELAIKQQAQDWLQQYQGEMINLGYGKQFVEEWGTYLKGLDIEYQKQWRETEAEIQREKNKLEQERNTIAWANWSLDQDRFTADKYFNTAKMQRDAWALGIQQASAEVENATKIADSIFGGVKTIGNILLPFSFAPINLPNVNLGGQNGKKKKSKD